MDLKNRGAVSICSVGNVSMFDDLLLNLAEVLKAAYTDTDCIAAVLLTARKATS